MPRVVSGYNYSLIGVRFGFNRSGVSISDTITILIKRQDINTMSSSSNNDDECPTTPVKPREEQAFVTAVKPLKRDEPAIAGKVVKRRKRRRGNGEVIATKPKAKKKFLKSTTGVRIVNHRDIVLETDPSQFRVEYDIEVFTKNACSRFTSLSEGHLRVYGVTTDQLWKYNQKHNVDGHSD